MIQRLFGPQTIIPAPGTPVIIFRTEEQEKRAASSDEMLQIIKNLSTGFRPSHLQNNEEDVYRTYSWIRKTNSTSNVMLRREYKPLVLKKPKTSIMDDYLLGKL